MPENHFVNQYHTNWITTMRTNVIDIYSTNFVTRTLTNSVVVDAFQTNFVTGRQTNWQTINLTNWQSVVLFKTNWTSQPVKTVVEVAVPNYTSPAVETAAPQESPAPRAVAAEPAAPPASSVTTDGLVIEASRAAHLSANGQAEITLKIRSAGEAASPLPVQQWRVEREDAAVLCFGQDQDFKRDLPVGRYKVEVRIQRDADTPLIARAILAITPREALLQPRLTAKR